MGKVYAQIYSLIRQDREGVLDALKTISEIGYDGVEIISSMVEGLNVQEFKKYLDDCGLQVISGMSLDSDEDLAFAQALGLKYVSAPVHANPKDRDALLKNAEELNAFGKKTAPYGIKAFYHNHANEFLKLDGEYPEDILIANTDPDLVAFEFDIGWSTLAGIDPAAYINKHPGRFPLIHVKECNRTAATEEDFEHFPKRIMDFAKKLAGDEIRKPGQPPKFPEEAKKMMYESRNWNCALGEGLVDWAAVRDAAEAQGVEAYISEREYYHINGNPEATAAGAAKLDFEYMRKVFG